MLVLDKKTILDDYKPEKIGCVIALFSTVNAFLLAGMIALTIRGISQGEVLTELLICAFLLFFFIGNIIAMVYEIKHKDSTATAIYNNEFAILKCRYIRNHNYIDTSTDT